ncbi:MAG TPA: class I SAM-dependent methyltransferase [Candidatus Elarobacter sp.]|nr:class I SAM-dependent methyltransferase [Candidatus Elarobacter sp.]
MSTLTRRLKDRYLTGHHRRVRGSSDHPTRHARLMLEEAARRRPGGGLLCDVGAGAEAAVASAAWPGRRVALDVVPGAGLDLIADGHALPLGDTTVAAVLLMEVLEHVSDPSRLLRECARVLAPGGHLCLTAPQYHITHNHPGDYFRYTRQGLEALCAQAGLRVVAAWATGGPLLVVFHAIELNLPPRPRLAFVALAYRLFDWLDGRLTGHGNRPGTTDAKGWALLAAKPYPQGGHK